MQVLGFSHGYLNTDVLGRAVISASAVYHGLSGWRARMHTLVIQNSLTTVVVVRWLMLPRHIRLPELN